MIKELRYKMPKYKRSKTNGKYFQDIPQPIAAVDYNSYKKVIDNIASEKRILLGILTDKANKSAEYVKAQQIEWKLGQEYRALQQKEQDQRNKLIEMIPNKFG